MEIMINLRKFHFTCMSHVKLHYEAQKHNSIFRLVDVSIFLYCVYSLSLNCFSTVFTEPCSATWPFGRNSVNKIIVIVLSLSKLVFFK